MDIYHRAGEIAQYTHSLNFVIQNLYIFTYLENVIARFRHLSNLLFYDYDGYLLKNVLTRLKNILLNLLLTIS